MYVRIVRPDIRRALVAASRRHPAEHGDALAAHWSGAASCQHGARVHAALLSRRARLLLALHDHALPALSGASLWRYFATCSVRCVVVTILCYLLCQVRRCGDTSPPALPGVHRLFRIFSCRQRFPCSCTLVETCAHVRTCTCTLCVPLYMSNNEKLEMCVARMLGSSVRTISTCFSEPRDSESDHLHHQLRRERLAELRAGRPGRHGHPVRAMC